MTPTRAAILLASLLSSGCVPYPIHKTLQPPAVVQVVGPEHQPLSGAEVTLIANAYPYGRESRRDAKLTGSDGTVTFEPVREWRMETLMIHGAEIFFWNWCVRKSGYLTFSTNHNDSSSFDSDLVVVLQQGESTPCPESFR